MTNQSILETCYLLLSFYECISTHISTRQGTAAVALAGLMAAMRLRGDGKSLADQVRAPAVFLWL